MLATIVVAVTLLIAFGLAVASLKRPGYALGLALGSQGLEQVLQANSPFFASRDYLWNTLTAGVVTLAVVASLIGGRYRFRGALQPAQTAVLLFLAFFVWSTQWSPVGDAKEMLISSGPYVISLVLLSPLLIQEVEDATIGLATAGVLSALICSYVALDSSIWHPSSTRLALRILGLETAANPMALGDLGALGFIALSLRPGQSNVKRLRTWASYALLGVILYVMARASRGETASALITVALTLFYQRRADQRGALALPLLLLGVTVAAVSASVFETGTAERYQATVVQRDIGSRVGTMAAMWEVYSNDPESWIVGLGANYSIVVSGGYPHNQAGQALTETGIVGLTFWLGAVILAFRAAAKSMSTDLDARWRFAASGFFAILIYFLGVSTKRGHVLDPTTFMAIVYAERFALSARTAQRAKREREQAAKDESELESQPLLSPEPSTAISG